MFQPIRGLFEIQQKPSFLTAGYRIHCCNTMFRLRGSGYEQAIPPRDHILVFPVLDTANIDVCNFKFAFLHNQIRQIHLESIQRVQKLEETVCHQTIHCLVADSVVSAHLGLLLVVIPRLERTNHGYIDIVSQRVRLFDFCDPRRNVFQN